MIPHRDHPSWGPWSAAEQQGRVVERLDAFVHGCEPAESVLPWAGRLSHQDRERLRDELALVLSEPAETGEPLDWQELQNLLREWAETAGADGVLIRMDDWPHEGRYAVDLRDRDLAALATASPAVQTAFYTLITRFLPHYPTAGHLLPCGRLKKLKNRGSWQIELPDGYRLRYVVDKLERTIYVTYLGPHPDRDTSGREHAARARMCLERHGQN